MRRCVCGALIVVVTVAGAVYHDPHTHDERPVEPTGAVAVAASTTSAPRHFVLHAEPGAYRLDGRDAALDSRA